MPMFEIPGVMEMILASERIAKENDLALHFNPVHIEKLIFETQYLKIECLNNFLCVLDLWLSL